MLQAIERVNREFATTTALITHNATIAAMADRVVRFADGRIAEMRVNPERQPAASLAW